METFVSLLICGYSVLAFADPRDDFERAERLQSVAQEDSFAVRVKHLLNSEDMAGDMSPGAPVDGERQCTENGARIVKGTEYFISNARRACRLFLVDREFVSKNAKDTISCKPL